MKTIMIIIGISMSIILAGCSANVNDETAKVLRSSIENTWEQNGFSLIFDIVEVKDCIAVNSSGNNYEGTAIVTIKMKNDKDDDTLDTHWNFKVIFDGNSIMLQEGQIDPSEYAELKKLADLAKIAAMCGWGKK